MLKLAKKFAIPNFAGGNKGEKTIKREPTQEGNFALLFAVTCTQ